MSVTPPNPPPPGQERDLPEPTTTGKIDFAYEPTGLKGETAWFLWGSLDSGKTPLIALHGGPGIPHNYILPIAHIYSDHGIPVLMYDQVGCGLSTAFPEKNGDGKFWVPEMFIAELENVIAHFQIKEYDLIGQSWGGMLAGQFAITQPKGLRKLIIEGGPDDIPAYIAVGNRFRKELPQEMQDALDEGDKNHNFEGEKYKEAEMEYNYRHLCRFTPWAQNLLDAFAQLEKDPTVYYTMTGPNEFNMIGTLKDWSIRDQTHKITEKTCPGGMLLMNGYYDTVQDETMEGLFYRSTCRTKWVRYALSSHLPMCEETEKFLVDLGRFLLDE